MVVRGDKGSNLRAETSAPQATTQMFKLLDCLLDVLGISPSLIDMKTAFTYCNWTLTDSSGMCRCVEDLAFFWEQEIEVQNFEQCLKKKFKLKWLQK